jgi:hypothetical protein
MKKGLELPVNMIIVIAIAVLVLVVISAYFASQTTGGFDTVAANQAVTSACGAWLSTNCETGSLDTITTTYKDANGNAQTLGFVLSKLGYTDANAQKRRCSCPGAV